MVKVRALKNLVHNSLSARAGTEFEADDALLQYLLTRKLVEVIKLPKPETAKKVLKEKKVVKVKAFPKIVKSDKPRSVK